MNKLSIALPDKDLANVASLDHVQIELDDKPIHEKVKWLILRDLSNLNWTIDLPTKDIPKLTISPPVSYDKETIKRSMSIKRQEILLKNSKWIEKNIDFARQNLANGADVLRSKIKPIIEICETPKQHRLFRILRYYWSSPYSEYVGRRIKIIVRDDALPNKPVIGIAALGSPIIHIPERDEWIGWNKTIRTKNLIYTLDAYIIGALPPYNYLLGGKLMSFILASNEIREVYKRKYKDKITLIEKRKADRLVGIFTTSLYGTSSQYNRMAYNDKVLYQMIGQTKGFGTLHLSQETINTMIEYLKSRNIIVSNKFGNGPSWTMRVIRTAGELLGFDAEFLLKHSFKRNIYFVSLAENSISYLNDREKNIYAYNYPMKSLVKHWKIRWYNNRKKNPEVIENVLNFKITDFLIR